MLSHRAYSASDLKTVFRPVLNSIRDLQAPFRAEATEPWIKKYFELLDADDSSNMTDSDRDGNYKDGRASNDSTEPSLTAGSSAAEAEGRSGAALHMSEDIMKNSQLLPLIPLFFEFCAACVEEIKRDVSLHIFYSVIRETPALQPKSYNLRMASPSYLF
jgi:hypothetical protein